MSSLLPNITITRRIIGFCRLAREQGFKVGLAETRDLLMAADLALLMPKQRFRYTARALMCSNHDDFERFDALFDRYWKRRSSDGQAGAERKVRQPDTAAHNNHSLVMSGGEGEQHPSDEGKKVTGASAVERLQKTDFSQLSAGEIERLDELARRLWQQMSRRLMRRMKIRRRREQMCLRQTMRQNITHGGEPIELKFRSRRTVKPRLVVLLDVSGSMDQYSLFFLKFVYALQQHFERVESFIFSTRLVRITEALNQRGLAATLKRMAREAEAWSSGTRIGECLQTFNAKFAKRVLARHAIVVVLSDGLDTGEPELFRGELRRIKQRTRKVIWLNPLLGLEDYQPITRGLSAAMPFIDKFISAHNLNSLLQLEKHLLDV